VALHALKDAINRRRHARHGAATLATIRVQGGNADIPCNLQDISVGGACLQLAEPLALPSYFVLVLQGQVERACSVVWRDRDRIGVRFR